jgi:hypothetical protein
VSQRLIPTGERSGLQTRDDGKRFVVRADEKLTAFVELEAAIFNAVNKRKTIWIRGAVGAKFGGEAKMRRRRFAILAPGLVVSRQARLRGFASPCGVGSISFLRSDFLSLPKERALLRLALSSRRGHREKVMHLACPWHLGSLPLSDWQLQHRGALSSLSRGGFPLRSHVELAILCQQVKLSQQVSP